MTLSQINNQIRIGWRLFFVVLLIALGCSCSSRKTSTEKVKEVQKIESNETITDKSKIETKTDTNIKEVIETKVDTEKNIVTETKTIKPIDATKKSNYKGIEFENAEINETKTIDLSKEKKVSIAEYNKAVSIAEKAIKEAKRLKELNAELVKELKNKKTEKTFSFWNLLWLLLLIPIYFVYKKYFSRFGFHN